MLNSILDNAKRNRFCLIKFSISLMMAEGAGAEALKDGIYSIFAENGPPHLLEDGYKCKVVTCASGGASVNFGKKTGLMKRMADERAWLVKIHYTNHRVELYLVY